MDNVVRCQVIINARKAGFRLRLDPNDDSKLLINGPKDKPQVLDDIRANQKYLVDALRNPLKVSSYVKRLRKGMSWLIQAYTKLDTGPPKLAETFVRNLHAWRDVEIEKQKLFPEHNTCPMGGCDWESGRQPIRCDVCTRKV